MAQHPSPSHQPRRSLGLSSALCVLLLAPVAVYAAYNPERLADLVKSERYQDAHDYALEQRSEHEGELEFDLFYGIAAIQVGELKEGVFALERVVAAEPGFDRARLELARGYFLLEDDRRARREFEIVLAHDPPAAVRSQIEYYLQAMQRRADRYETTATGFVEIGGGYDSNVNSATSEDTVSTILGDVILADDSKERDDTFIRVEARGSVSHPLSPGFNLVAGAGLWDRSLSDESEFETGALDGNLGLLWRRERSRLLVSTQVQRFYLDGDAYRDLLGLGASYRHDVSDQLDFDVSARVTELDFEDLDDRDSTLTLIDAGISHRFEHARRPIVTAGLFFGTEEAEDDTTSAQANAQRDIYGVRAGLWLALAPRWTLRGSAEFRNSEYDEEDLLLGETRDEDYYALSVAADWRPSARWRIGPQLRYSRNDANTELHDYERTEAWVRARYEFY